MAEVTTGRSERRQRIEWAHRECKNAVAWNHLNKQSSATSRAGCHIESSAQEPLCHESPNLPWSVEHAGCVLSRCQKIVTRKTSFERLRETVPCGEKVLAKQVSTDAMNRRNLVRRIHFLERTQHTFSREHMIAHSVAQVITGENSCVSFTLPRTHPAPQCLR